MLAYEDHFRVLQVHIEVRPSEKGSDMKLNGVRNEALFKHLCENLWKSN